MSEITSSEAMSSIKKIAAALQLELTTTQIENIYHYLCLLLKWNKTYNLTAIREMSSMLDLHIADSLSIGPYLQGQHILDIGTGAGLPGLPLAICYPQKQFTLLDSVGKKIRFLRHVVSTLGLKNITLVQARVEAYSAAQPFDVIMARAVATLSEIYRLSQHLCQPAGYFLLQKGEYPQAELAELTCPYEVIKITVPGLRASRHLVRIQKGESHD